MSVFDQIGGILQQYADGRTPNDADVHAHYDQIAATVPPDQLGGVLGPALSQLATSVLGNRIGATAVQMPAPQRAQFVQTLLAGLTPTLLARLGVSPGIGADPASASPTDIGALAAHAKEERPEVFNRAMALYAEHPLLVKMLGTLAVAKVAQHLAKR
jgi:hypothetical protein